MKASLVLGRSSVSMMLFVMSLFFTVVTHAQQLPADEIIGAWEAEDGSVKLDMYKAGPEFEARLLYGNQVVESDNATFKLDTKNPNPALRSRSLKTSCFSRVFAGRMANGPVDHSMTAPPVARTPAR